MLIYYMYLEKERLNHYCLINNVNILMRDIRLSSIIPSLHGTKFNTFWAKIVLFLILFFFVNTTKQIIGTVAVLDSFYGGGGGWKYSHSGTPLAAREAESIDIDFTTNGKVLKSMV